MSYSISVVVPVFNSEQTLEELSTRLVTVLNTLTADFEILLVDDGSRDRSFEKMQRIQTGDERIKLLKLAGNFGQQNALLCGLRHTSKEIVITIDDDLQHPPEELPKLVAKIAEGYQAVFGVPYDKKHQRYRNLGTKLTGWLLNRISQKDKSLKSSSFRALNREVVEKIIEYQDSFVYLAPMIFGVTDKVTNIMVSHQPRHYGRSNYNLIRLLKLFLNLILYYSKYLSWVPVKRNKKPQYVVEKTIWDKTQGVGR